MVDFPLSREEQILRLILIERARKHQGPMSYRECGEALQPHTSIRIQQPWTVMFPMLGNISKFEHLNGRPLLSVLVVGQYTRIPGNGFFTFCRSKLHIEIVDNKAFHAEQLEKVYAQWIEDRNYQVAGEVSLPTGGVLRVFVHSDGKVRLVMDGGYAIESAVEHHPGVTTLTVFPKL